MTPSFSATTACFSTASFLAKFFVLIQPLIKALPGDSDAPARYVCRNAPSDIPYKPAFVDLLEFARLTHASQLPLRSAIITYSVFLMGFAGWHRVRLP
jgi:hypothetical protein